MTNVRLNILSWGHALDGDVRVPEVGPRGGLHAPPHPEGGDLPDLRPVARFRGRVHPTEGVLEELPEVPGEQGLLGGSEVLVREDEDVVLEPGPLQRGHGAGLQGN